MSMADSNETNELLREIRDLVALREQVYLDYLARHEKASAEHAQRAQQANDQHLAKVEKAWAEQLDRQGRRNREREHYMWFMLFVITFGAVYAALFLSK
jgi:hypothetical protein